LLPQKIVGFSGSLTEVLSDY
jgi:hypothetical protein